MTRLISWIVSWGTLVDTVLYIASFSLINTDLGLWLALHFNPIKDEN